MTEVVELPVRTLLGRLAVNRELIDRLMACVGLLDPAPVEPPRDEVEEEVTNESH